MHRIYQTKGEFWTLVVSKRGIANLLTADESNQLLDQGAIRLDWAGHKLEDPQVILTAIGSYQLEEVLKASQRLRHYDLPHSVVYMLEPGRFRIPRDGEELAHAAGGLPAAVASTPAPPCPAFLSPTPALSPWRAPCSPYIPATPPPAFWASVNQGGTLDKDGMLFINRCTWAHVLAEVAQVLDRPLDDWLSQNELDALHGRRSPQGVLDLTP